MMPGQIRTILVGKIEPEIKRWERAIYDIENPPPPIRTKIDFEGYYARAQKIRGIEPSYRPPPVEYSPQQIDDTPQLVNPIPDILRTTNNVKTIIDSFKTIRDAIKELYPSYKSFQKYREIEKTVETLEPLECYGFFPFTDKKFEKAVRTLRLMSPIYLGDLKSRLGIGTQPQQQISQELPPQTDKVTLIPRVQTDDKSHYKVEPKVKIGYPETFTYWEQSREKLAQKLSETRQVETLQNAFERLRSDLYSYKRGGTLYLGTEEDLEQLLGQLSKLETGLESGFARYLPMDNLDESLFDVLQKYMLLSKSAIENEKSALDRQNKAINEGMNRERIPSQNV